jgi:UDP-3-O-[3-hydroxymyristoyl] N-acetylglucosamine deacetylase
VVEGDKQLLIEPSLRQRVKCSIEFKTKVIGAQSLEYRSSLENFLSIADARTFCHLSDVQAMREKGLALGGGLDNAIVVTESGILNDSGLRAEDEFVRHKLLDLIGDFALLGAPLLADVYAHKSGHALHAKAMKLLLAEKDFYLEEICPETAELVDILPTLSLLPQFALHYA